VSWVAAVSLLVAVGAMAVDHLLGTDGDDDGAVADPAMFAIASSLSLAAAAALFLWFVPREQRARPGRAARTGLVCSVLSVVPGVALIWLGIPFVVAGAGVELGLGSRRGSSTTTAVAAVGLGGIVLVLGATVFLYQGVVSVSER
jgi:hypothetical protein